MSTDVTPLDDTDMQIINLLASDGRASFAEIGKTVGLSPHGAADRVRRLLRNGVITGFRATVELANVGRTLDAFIDVQLSSNTSSEKFEQFVLQLPAVQEIAFVTGRFDFHVRVACHSAEDLDRTVRSIRREGGAAQTETRIVLRSTASAHPIA